MRVICENNKYFKKEFKIGDIFDTNEDEYYSSDSIIWISSCRANDSNDYNETYYCVDKNYFKPIIEHRNDKINKLLVE